MKSSKTQVIDLDLLDKICNQASEASRRRMNHNFHRLEDTVQRFLNAIEPDSYIRPHRHVDPLKDETFLVLRGSGAVIIFGDDGSIAGIHILDPEKGFWGVDIPGGLYHTILSFSENSVFFELKAGPYDPNADKGFSEWSPEEGSPEAETYLDSLKKLALKTYHRA